MNEVVTAVEKMLSYLKQAETRRILEADRAIEKFHNGADLVKDRYFAAKKSGQDQDFVAALEEAPIQPPFVLAHLKAQKG